MITSQEQIEYYQTHGLFFFEKMFNSVVLDLLQARFDLLLKNDSPQRILEKSGEVRTLFIESGEDKIIESFISQERLLRPVMDFIGTEVYPHQIKMNAKLGISGDVWKWHQDFTYWHIEDGMPEPNVLTAVIFLDDVNEFNGPMYLVPKTHNVGMLDKQPNVTGKNASLSYMSTLTADLKYTIKRETLARYIDEFGIYSAKGEKGSVLFFHGNLFHASPNNLSPWDRRMLFITYNSIENSLKPVPNPRPGFIANRNPSPLSPLTPASLMLK